MGLTGCTQNSGIKFKPTVSSMPPRYLTTRHCTVTQDCVNPLPFGSSNLVVSHFFRSNAFNFSTFAQASNCSPSTFKSTFPILRFSLIIPPPRTPFHPSYHRTPAATMESVDYSLHPKGDLILILSNPDAPFAVWSDSLVWPDAMLRKSAAGPASDDSADESEQNDELEDSARLLEDTELPEVRFRLSSQHLVLASPYFRAMLDGPWKEVSADANATHTVRAEDWNTNALLILFNIIHGHNRKVPRALTLESLAQVGVLVDYYQCHEAVDLFSSVWRDNLYIDTPIEYGRDAILLLFVSSVFRYKDYFSLVSKAIFPKVRGPIHTLDLPIPSTTTGEYNCTPSCFEQVLISTPELVESHRQDKVRRILTSLFDCNEHLSSGKYICNSSNRFHSYEDTYLCSCALLGALHKFMMRHGVLSPRPVAPFLGFGCDQLTTRIINIREPWSNRDMDHTHCTLQGSLSKATQVMRQLPFPDQLEEYENMSTAAQKPHAT